MEEDGSAKPGSGGEHVPVLWQGKRFASTGDVPPGCISGWSFW